MHKHKRMIRCLLVALLAVLFSWTLWSNKALELNTYVISSDNLPDGFSGFRIAQIADLHNTQIGKDNEKLLALLRQAEPDLIAITGDLIDSRNTDITVALDFVEEAVKIAPCYYVSGNHEARIDDYDTYQIRLSELGVTILEDTSFKLETNNEAITIIGIEDPSFITDYLLGDAASVAAEKLNSLVSDDGTFQLLLSHRPELFHVYVESGLDLVLSGHAHGGQFRFPFIGGLFAPNQGFFPEYDAGLYQDGNTNMIVSRGIGNSLIPFRFNNRPELILIELYTAKTSG